MQVERAHYRDKVVAAVVSGCLVTVYRFPGKQMRKKLFTTCARGLCSRVAQHVVMMVKEKFQGILK